MRILLIIFIFFYTSFAKENNEIDILVANFCKTTDKYVPTLFRALKIGSVMLTGDVVIIDLLDRIVGNNPGYTMQYLAENNFNNTERLALIKQWEEIFELNKENILKKRYYKRKYYGKKSCQLAVIYNENVKNVIKQTN